MIDRNNITISSNNITLRKGNVKPYGCDKIYMDKDLIQDKLYQLIDQFNKQKLIIEFLFCTTQQHTSILRWII